MGLETGRTRLSAYGLLRQLDLPTLLQANATANDFVMEFLIEGLFHCGGGPLLLLHRLPALGDRICHATHRSTFMRLRKSDAHSHSLAQVHSEGEGEERHNDSQHKQNAHFTSIVNK